MPAPRAMTSGRMFSLETILSRRAFSTLSSLPRSGRMAWKRRSRPCLAEPPGRVALDDVQLALGRVALLAVGQLAGQRHALERALADDQVASLAGGLAGARGGQATSRSMRRPSAGFSSRYWPIPSATAAST